MIIFSIMCVLGMKVREIEFLKINKFVYNVICKIGN